MEPIKDKVKVYLGEFIVVQTKLDGITIDLGRNIHITMHLGDFTHDIKPGDKLPLFTEIQHAIPERTPVQ
jgi:hypothetical protein